MSTHGLSWYEFYAVHDDDDDDQLARMWYVKIFLNNYYSSGDIILWVWSRRILESKNVAWLVHMIVVVTTAAASTHVI